MYHDGLGVPQDYAAAIKWYRLAADEGNANAQAGLASMYAEGQGVPQDYAAAIEWYRLAADQGNANAQYNLGTMYARGEGLPRDNIRAHMWLNLSAAQGEQDAAESRDRVARGMTPAQIAQAQKLAREWKPGAER
jgi:TPR repeat protein